MTDEWGPWIDHDGSGKPVPNGVIVERVYANGWVWVAPMGERCRRPTATVLGPYRGQLFCGSWDWSRPGNSMPVVRYRIKVPRGMAQIRAALREVESGVKPPVKEEEVAE